MSSTFCWPWLSMKRKALYVAVETMRNLQDSARISGYPYWPANERTIDVIGPNVNIDYEEEILSVWYEEVTTGTRVLDLGVVSLKR